MPSIYALLRKHSLRTKKSLGQHFLAAVPTIDKIVAALHLTADDDVLEIGPGLGIMTRKAAESARRVLAVERDAQLLAIAREESAAYENIRWIEADILDCTVDVLRSAAGAPQLAPRLKLLGNLPYNISSPILFWFLDQRNFFSEAVIMIQKEVAIRLAARPGTRDCGILSVLLQAVVDVQRLFDVSAESFVPPPKVLSSVVRLTVRPDPLVLPADEETFRRTVRAAFGHRRKTIRNALLGSALLRSSPSAVDQALSSAHIDPRARPETVSIEAFVVLAKTLASITSPEDHRSRGRRMR
jgi:16S rRNA (adenine1518-N6/adenine1519-N6)-dimethyltransferase